MDKKLPLAKVLAIAAAAAGGLALIVLLCIWTADIASGRERDALAEELGKVAAEGGESAVLSLAGYNVSNIFHGEEGLVLFEEGSEAWTLSADEMQNVTAYEKAAPSVVEIYEPGTLNTSAGCGVVISSDGHIVTNSHVLGTATGYVVRFFDGTEADAELVGTDPVTDIAVIKVPKTSTLKPIAFRSADELVVGQKAIAIGSPYGYSWTQTVGTVSALGRTVTSSTGISLSGLIQTDAAVNPGNSGGPLLDAKGRMIGLNTAIYSTTGSALGISFAIPVDTVVSVAGELMRSGSVSRGTLDILSVELNPMIAGYAGLEIPEGVLVSQVVPGGEADKGGLRGGSQAVQYGSSTIYLGGDVITRIEDSPIRGYDDYYAFMADTKAGDKVDVTVWRNGSETVLRNVPLVLQTAENMRWLIR